MSIHSTKFRLPQRIKKKKKGGKENFGIKILEKKNIVNVATDQTKIILIQA